MGPLLGLAQVALGAADDDLLLIGDILVQNVPQGQDAGLELASTSTRASILMAKVV